MTLPMAVPWFSVRRAVVIFLALLLLCASGVSAAQRAGAASVAEELGKAQRRANAAAERLSKAESTLARTEEQVTRAKAKVADSEAQIAAAGDQVRALALSRYVGGGADEWEFLSMADANESAIARVLTDVAAGESTNSLGRLRAEREDLADALKALEGSERANAGALSDLRKQRAAAASEVERLGRRAKELEAQAATEAANRAKKAAPKAAPVGAAANPAPASATPTPASATPGPAAGAAPAVGGASWVCPVQGSRTFTDDYGDPRPGGKSHDGNDILAPRGTPVVANVAGTLTHNQSGRGGLSYYLKGDDGNTYFGAHLDSYGAVGRMTAGTQIGTVGTTGDAQGGPPHLHFEIHPGGGSSINPYVTLKKYC